MNLSEGSGSIECPFDWRIIQHWPRYLVQFISMYKRGLNLLLKIRKNCMKITKKKKKI